MLHLLQQLTSAKPPPSGKTRQQTIEAAFSRVGAQSTFKDASTTPSLTTAPSLTDASSELAEDSAKSDEAGESPARVGSLDLSYIRKATSGEDGPSDRKNGLEAGSHVVPDENLVYGTNVAQEHLLDSSCQALDPSWNLPRMLGNRLDLPANDTSQMSKRTSTRLNILGRASKVIEKTTSVLGKRVREGAEAGMRQIQSMKGDRRSSLRSKDPEPPSFEGPQKKRTRFSETQTDNVKSPEPLVQKKTPKKRTKQWLSQGLWLGQDPDFDPRLTETQNRLKRASKENDGKRQNPKMPLPMFLGWERLQRGSDFKLPFSVFSPLPPGQPKPDEWKKVQKNVFIGEAAKAWKKQKLKEHSTCACTPESCCDEDCHNRNMLYECDESNCILGPNVCTNRAFAELKERCKKGGKYNIGVEVIKTANRGYGIRANRTFEPNQIIVEYTGEVITQDECDKRMNTIYKAAECYYLMDFDQSMILDATRGSIARFVNHSCAPNCRMIKWTVDKKPRVGLFAGDNGIMTGEELTYDYKFSPYSVKNVQECRCGAEHCRGVLGPKPKEIRDALKPIIGAGKRKVTQMLEGAVENAVGAAKRRKMNVPSSVKDAVAAGKGKVQKAKPKVKPLPKGWVYPEEAQEFRKVNDVDPEEILRRLKRGSRDGRGGGRRRTIS